MRKSVQRDKNMPFFLPCVLNTLGQAIALVVIYAIGRVTLS